MFYFCFTAAHMHFYGMTPTVRNVQTSGCSSWWCLALCLWGQHGLFKGQGWGSAGAGLGPLSKAPLSDSHRAANTPTPSVVTGSLGTQPRGIGGSGFTSSASILELPQPRYSQLSPCLSSHFLHCVWVVKGYGWGLSLDRGQAMTKDWLALKTLGNVYRRGGSVLHTHSVLKKWSPNELTNPWLSPHYSGLKARKL